MTLVVVPTFAHIFLEAAMKLHLACPLIALPALLACSANSPDGNPFGTTSPPADAGSDAPYVAPEAAAETSADTSGDAVVVFDSGFTGDGSLSKDSACAVETIEAEEVPIDLFIMADCSGSMSGSGWDAQSAGLNAFFTDPLSKGITVALSFFPRDGSCTSEVESCNGDLYYKPQVNWGLLPSHASTLATAIAAQDTNGCTPTQDALNGVLRGARDRQAVLKDHVVAAVLVSDGEPCCGMCPIESDDGLGQIAYQYANPSGGEPPIRTFAIYADSTASDSMTAIAVQGGTGQAYNATGGTSAFITALDDIRAVLLACEYKMPVPEAGVVNPEVIEVEYTPSSGDAEQIPRIKPPEECGTDAGWYYDDDTNPTRIILCPATCETVQEDPEGRVDVLVGCSSSQR